MIMLSVILLLLLFHQAVNGNEIDSICNASESYFNYHILVKENKLTQKRFFELVKPWKNDEMIERERYKTYKNSIAREGKISILEYWVACNEQSNAAEIWLKIKESSGRFTRQQVAIEKNEVILIALALEESASEIDRNKHYKAFDYKRSKEYYSSRVNTTAEGVYFSTHETSAFVVCGTNERWWFDGESRAFKKIIDLYSSLVREPYGSLYLSVEGQFTKKPGNADYIGSFEPKKLLSYSLETKIISKCVVDIEKLKY